MPVRVNHRVGRGYMKEIGGQSERDAQEIQRHPAGVDIPADLSCLYGMIEHLLDPLGLGAEKVYVGFVVFRIMPEGVNDQGKVIHRYEFRRGGLDGIHDLPGQFYMLFNIFFQGDTGFQLPQGDDLHELVDHCHEKFFLVPEMMIQRAFGEAHLFADVTDGNSLVAFCQKKPVGRFNDKFFGVNHLKTY